MKGLINSTDPVHESLKHAVLQRSRENLRSLRTNFGGRQRLKQ